MGIYRIGIGRDYGLTGNAVYGYDTIGPSTSGAIDVSTLEKHAIAAYATPDFWLGQLGLSMFALNISDTNQPHSFLSRLKEEGYIPSLSFGYQAGAPYRFTKVPGSLILGGYDRARRSNDTLLVPSTEDTIIGLQSVTAAFKNGTVADLLNTGILAVLETSVPELWLPPSVCDSFASALDLTYHEASDRYVLTDTVHRRLQDTSPSFNFIIGTSISGRKTITIEIPYAAFDLQAKYPIFASTTNYFPLRRAANESQYALGRAFLQEVYMSVDWERDVFNISQALFSSPPPAPDIIVIEPKNKTLISLPGPTPREPQKLAAGAIAGIVIGSLLFFVFLVGGAWWLSRRRKLAKYAAEAQALPLEGRKDPNDFAPETVDKPPGERLDVELEGQPVGEMYAPHGESEIQHLAGNESDIGTKEVIELDSPQPIYELPTSGPGR
ncbi:acid protease [Cucurbitaria berberidis CBS 394.84]|uniref:Acid protease n=1 Tax=Cucurbitaria berberidis CBS 394.84 TaxID=1168544 RepID=A0A9P4L2V7_9PLEO|nr:acid protease [Cucurbitaria berberidis CBS 394.84]KAF1839976.1 acid protease [Cucurbitaria berberidis CBS 394.84]